MAIGAGPVPCRADPPSGGANPDAAGRQPLPGAVQLPDGSWVRGRGLRQPAPAGADPTFGLYLGVRYQPEWEHSAVDWPDFWLPRQPLEVAHLLRRAHEQARDGGRVEIACLGGCGRTGTAIAAMAILAGVDSDLAVSWARRHYDRHAVEAPWQRRWVRRFPLLLQAGSSR